MPPGLICAAWGSIVPRWGNLAFLSAIRVLSGKFRICTAKPIITGYTPPILPYISNLTLI